MRHTQNLTPEDRKTWRRWQAGWVCFYLLLATALFEIGSNPPPRHAEFAQSMPAQVKPIRAPP